MRNCSRNDVGGGGRPRLTDADRELLRRLVDGDLRDEFQAALDAVSAADPSWRGGAEHDD